MKNGVIIVRKTKLLLFCALFLTACQQQQPVKETVCEEPQEKETSVSLTFTGDLLFEQGLYDWWDSYSFGDYFDRLKPYLKGDLVIGNQEVPIGGEKLGISGTAYSFNAPVEVAQQLPDVGFDVMTLSNNHSYDRGYDGVKHTLKNLQDNGISTVGLYADQESADEVTVIEKNGIKIAFLAYTYDTNVPIEAEYSFVTKTFLNENHEFDKEHREMLKKDVLAAKEKADAVIVAMHWGNEFTYELNSSQKKAAAYLNDLGVDIIVGNHSHCIQTMDRLINEDGKETVVFYSLGNLVSAAAMVDRASIDFANMYELGAVANMNIVMDLETKEVAVEDLELTPYVNHFDADYHNFQLIPLKDYTEEMALQHCQRLYSAHFTKEWLQEQTEDVYERKIKLDI